MSNHYVFGFGTVRFVVTIGSVETTIDFDTRGFLILKSHGRQKTDLLWNKKERLYGFHGTIKNMVENFDSVTSANLVLLIRAISDLVYNEGDGTNNKTITIIPAYSSESNAINEEYEVGVQLGSNIGAVDELSQNVESVQYWEFNWTVYNNIKTLPTNLTLLSETVLTGDDDEDLTGDDDEDLTEG